MTFFSDGVRALLSPRYTPATQRFLAGVAREQDRQYAQGGGGVSLGWLATQVAEAVGLAPPDAVRVGHLLDLLQPAIDLADNLADAEEDQAAGRDPRARYPGVPRAGLPFLPALAVGTVVAELSRFPVPLRGVHAVDRLLSTLGALNEVQARPLGMGHRSRDIGIHFVTLACVPAWLVPTAGEGLLDEAAVECWARRVGATVQTRWDALEDPGNQRLRLRFLRLRRAALRDWPTSRPFGAGCALSASRVLPGLP